MVGAPMRSSVRGGGCTPASAVSQLSRYRKGALGVKLGPNFWQPRIDLQWQLSDRAGAALQ